MESLFSLIELKKNFSNSSLFINQQLQPQMDRNTFQRKPQNLLLSKLWTILNFSLLLKIREAVDHVGLSLQSPPLKHQLLNREISNQMNFLDYQSNSLLTVTLYLKVVMEDGCTTPMTTQQTELFATIMSILIQEMTECAMTSHAHKKRLSLLDTSIFQMQMHKQILAQISRQLLAIKLLLLQLMPLASNFTQAVFLVLAFSVTRTHLTTELSFMALNKLASLKIVTGESETLGDQDGENLEI